MNVRSLKGILGGVGLTVLGALGLVGDTGCAREPTAVILAVTTDMSVIQDLDEVGLFVGVNGEVKSSLRTFVSTEVAAKLPGTVSILEPEEANKPVHIRVAGYKNGQLRVVRDAIVTVPPKELTVLRMPLGWLSATQKRPAASGTSGTARAGQVKPKALTEEEASFKEFDAFFPGYVSPCATGETSDDGACITVLAEPQRTTYGDLVRDVFGGSVSLNEETGVAEGGVCFDMEACFKNEQTLKVPDYPECKVTIPESIGNTVNFALVRNLASGCDGYECFVPLDADKRWDAASRVYTLPKEACERVKSTDPAVKVERIAVATACEKKYEATPRCNGLYGAVRDKAPSDPSRPRYYKEEPPNPPPPTVDGGVPEGGTPDGGDAGPKGPTLLARLTQLQNPRRLAITSSHLWVRGRIGLGFLSPNGVSTPTEIATLPAAGGVADADNGTLPLTLSATGLSACTSTLIVQKTARWCYDLATNTRAAIDAPYTGDTIVTGSRIGTVVPSGIELDYPTLETRRSFANRPPDPPIVSGAFVDPGNRVYVGFVINEPSIRRAVDTLANSDQLLEIFATYPAPYDGHQGRVEFAQNADETFFTLGRPDTQAGGIFRRRTDSPSATPADALTTNQVPYATGSVSPQLAADKDYVYWGGGVSGPMAISTCTTRTVSPKQLFPSTGGVGGQNNTTYAVVRSGNKLFFATDDGRVYSMDPPAPEPCP
ncbi:MAG: hypothetical protein IPK71_08630 [Myxococcales bacterium]|nr:hypothetical protein [Myxococcales bacterium]